MAKPWRQVATPHRDIRDGKFDESVFAADLADVVADRGPIEYRDAETFFAKTYLTQGLRNLLSTVLSRLSATGKGEGVLQLRTPFGGGKTHSLLALYHLCRNGKRVQHLDSIKEVMKGAGVKSLPPLRVITFVGTAADALKGKTPWGELAEQVGDYGLLKEHDQKRRAPGKDLLHKLLGDKPTLILMDETGEYCVRAKDFEDQVMAFFHELTETVKVLDRCALVVTLTSSSPYGEEGEKALQRLQNIFGRVEAIYTPVDGEESYEIIRRRLFEDVGDPKQARITADEYYQLYQRLGDDAPSFVRDTTYREKIRNAYPFHPELIDILFERWSTYSTFQRTRGVLRMLAEIVSDLYRREHTGPLIQPAHINLVNPAVRREFIKHIGNEFEGVVASDIADGNAKAQRIDREMGSEYARFAVASDLASAIFFYSFPAGQNQGAGSTRLRVAFLRDEVPPPVVGDALGRLEEELWYLHTEKGLYYFAGQPNLNRIIVDKEEGVSDAQIAQEISTRLERMAGNELKVYLTPSASNDLPDNRDLKLAVLANEQHRRSPATAQFIEELLNRSGIAFRTYRNTLLVLVADHNEFATLRQRVKRALALKAIREDRALMANLSPENKQTLESKWKDAEGGIPFGLLSAYRHLAKAGKDGVEWFDLGLPTVGEKNSLAKRVRDYLKSQELLLDKIGPRQVLQKTLKEDETEKLLGEIYDAFLKYPHLPMLESEGVLHGAVQQGVRDGVFGLRSNSKIFWQEPAPASAFDNDAKLVREETARQEKAGVPQPGGEPVPPGVPRSPEPQPGGWEPQPLPLPLPQPGTIQTLALRIQVPWDKMADFVRGVLMPLRKDGAEIDVEVSLTARSADGIQKSTLDHKVKETISQIGAKIIEEKHN